MGMTNNGTMSGDGMAMAQKAKQKKSPSEEEEQPYPVAGSTMQILILKGETDTSPTLPSTFKNNEDEW
eukprot:2688210-Prorocentrum_lima.AAC.1